MMIVSHNLTAMNTQRQLGINNRIKAKSTEKLASGYRINRAADDAAGLSISEKMRRQIRGLNQGAQNSEDGISLLNVADGALDEVQDMIIRINELSVQASNDTNSLSDRQAIQNEIDSLTTEINRISYTTEFNSHKIFNTGYIVDADYGINDEFIFDEKALLSTMRCEGIPTNTSELIYNISADANTGLTINGNNLAWSNITSSANNSLADNTILGGNYDFNYNGSKISFYVESGSTLNDIATALDGVQINISPKTSNTLQSISIQCLNGSSYITAGTYTISTTEKYIYCLSPNGNKQLSANWNDIELNTNNNTCNITLSNANYKASISMLFDNPPTKDDIQKVLNGATFEGVFDYITSNYSAHMAENIFVNGQQVTTDEVEIRVSKLSDEFCLQHNIDLTSNGFQGKFNIDANSLKWKYTYDNHDYYITPESEQLLNDIDANGGVNDGDSIFVSFSDGYASFEIEYHILYTDEHSDVRGAIGMYNPATGENVPMSVTAKMFPRRKFDNIINTIQQPVEYIYTLSKNGETINPTQISNTTSKNKGQLWIQSGDTKGNGMYITIGDMNTSLLGLNSINVLTSDDASKCIDKTSKALDIVSKQRARIGAQHNRLEHAINITKNIEENTQYAESRIRDTNMAEEMMKHTTTNMLEQVSQTMLAQANQSQQGVLNLLN